MLGDNGITTAYQETLFDAQLVVLELALITGISGIMRRGETQKKMLSHSSAILLIVGTILLSIGSAYF